MKKGILSVLSMLIGGLVATGIAEKRNRKKINDAWKMSEKHLNLLIMMSEWVRIKQEGKNISASGMSVSGGGAGDYLFLRNNKFWLVGQPYGAARGTDGENR